MVEWDNCADGRIRIAVSSCLLGHAVRYDSGHKRCDYIVNTLAKHFDLVPFCPEVAIGLGAPRPPIRLVSTGKGIRAVGIQDPSLDVTNKLKECAEGSAIELKTVSAYIFKKSSPSCGIAHVEVFGSGSAQAIEGVGIFAHTIMQRQPLLPIEEEDGVLDAMRRDNFIERVYIFHRWQQLLNTGLTPETLLDFHARYKMNVYTRDKAGHKKLQSLLNGLNLDNCETIAQRYVQQLMQIVQQPVSRIHQHDTL